MHVYICLCIYIYMYIYIYVYIYMCVNVYMARFSLGSSAVDGCVPRTKLADVFRADPRWHLLKVGQAGAAVGGRARGLNSLSPFLSLFFLSLPLPLPLSLSLSLARVRAICYACGFKKVSCLYISGSHISNRLVRRSDPLISNTRRWRQRTFDNPQLDLVQSRVALHLYLPKSIL